MNPSAKHTQATGFVTSRRYAAERSPVMTVVTPVMLVRSPFQG
jgi:hypothetical protein